MAWTWKSIPRLGWTDPQSTVIPLEFALPVSIISIQHIIFGILSLCLPRSWWIKKTKWHDPSIQSIHVAVKCFPKMLLCKKQLQSLSSTSTCIVLLWHVTSYTALKFRESLLLALGEETGKFGSVLSSTSLSRMSGSSRLSLFKINKPSKCDQTRQQQFKTDFSQLFTCYMVSVLVMSKSSEAEKSISPFL